MGARSVSRTALAVAVVVIVIIVAVGAYYGYVLTRPKTSSTTSSTPTSTTSVTTTTITTSTSVTTSISPTTLVVATYTGAPAQPYLQLAADIFMQEHPGVKVEVVAYPFNQYISNELTVLEAGGSQYDIVTYTTTTVGLVAPYLLPLNSSIINESDILPPDLDAAGIYYNITTGQRTWVGVPIQTDGIVLIYNSKYFDNATLQQEFYSEYGVNLTPNTWQNWTDVLEADQFFVSHGITKYGILAYTDIPDIMDTFLIVFGHYYVANSSLNCGNPMGMIGFGTAFMGCVPSYWNHRFPPPAINSTDGVEALETLRQLVSYMPSPTQLQVSFDNELQLLNESGFAPAGFGYIGMLPSIANTSFAQQLRIAPLPGGLIRIGLTYVGINKYSAHRQLAIEFLQLIMSPQFQEEAFIKTYVFPSSISAYHGLISNASLPAYLREWLSAALEAANKPEAVIAPYVPVIMTSTMKTQVATYIYNYVTGQTSSPMQALQQAAAAYAKALESAYG